MDNTPRVTAIKPQKRNLHRYAIFVNDEFATGVSEEVIVKLQLRLGEPVTTQRLAQIVAAEQDSQTQRAALNLLEHRARTRHELIRRLRIKGLPDESVQRVVEQLQAQGQINDEEFARQMARSLARSKHLSKQAILRKIGQAGVDREAAQTVIEQELADYDERHHSEQAAHQQMRHLGGLEPTVQRRRLYSYLQRRGFPHALIVEVIDELLTDDH